MKRVLQTIVRDTERYSISNSSELSLSKPDLYIEKIELQGGATATTEDIVVTRSGKNLLDGNLRTTPKTQNGITIQYLPDEDCYLLNGTCTANSSHYLITHNLFVNGRITASIVVISGTCEGTAQFSISYRDDLSETTFPLWVTKNIVNGNLSINQGVHKYIGATWFFVAKGTLFNSYKIKIQIEKGLTVTEYEPYLLPKSITFSRDYLLSLKGVNNLLDKSKFPATQTINGITYINNGDGTITVESGTATRESYLRVYECTDLIKATYGHKFAIFGGTAYVKTTETDKINFHFRIEINSAISLGGADSNGKGAIFTNNKIATDSINYSYAYIYSVKSGQTIPKLVFKPQLYDLTTIYGEGNEPTTVEQFLKTYPLSSTDKLTITKNSVKYNDTDITSEVTGLDEFFGIDANVSTVITNANIALGEITEDISYSVKSNKRAVYTGEDVIYSSQTFIKE